MLSSESVPLCSPTLYHLVPLHVGDLFDILVGVQVHWSSRDLAAPEQGVLGVLVDRRLADEI